MATPTGAPATPAPATTRAPAPAPAPVVAPQPQLVVQPAPPPRVLTPEERAEQYKEERRRQYGIR